MRAGLRPRLTYANVVSTLCLFILLGGGAYAAVKIPRNSVGASQLKRNAVTSPKVKNGSLLAQDFGPGQLPAGAKGDQGDQGAPGANGAPGAGGAPGTNGAPGANGQDATAPQGAVMFFELGTCPTGWTELASARGRYLVGRPSGGTLSAEVGTPLGNTENRPFGLHNHGSTSTAGGHSHTITSGILDAAGSIPNVLLRGSSDPTDVAVVNATNAAGDHSHATNNAGTVMGTNAPYLQLLACKKN
jgi:hypothetical protein